MKKKVIALLLGASMIASFALGCGNGSTPTASSSAAGSSSAAAVQTIKTKDDLKGKKIGVQQGTTGDIFVTDEYGEDNVSRFNNGMEAVQALSQGKVDAVVIDDQPAKAFVKAVDGIKIIEEEFVKEDYAIAVSKKNTDLTKKINDALKELKADGTVDKIVNYYIYDDESKRGERYAAKTDVKRDGKFIMATNAAFPPYEFQDGGNVVGIDADLAQAIADKLGMELKIEDMAFDSIISAVQSGKASVGIAGMTVTEDRLKSIDFTDSYYTGKQVIIVKG